MACLRVISQICRIDSHSTTSTYLYVQAIHVCKGINCYCAEAKLFASSNDSDGNFSSIRNKDFSEVGCLNTNAPTPGKPGRSSRSDREHATTRPVMPSEACAGFTAQKLCMASWLPRRCSYSTCSLSSTRETPLKCSTKALMLHPSIHIATSIC